MLPVQIPLCVIRPKFSRLRRLKVPSIHSICFNIIFKNHLYKQPNPNTYLATFARFVIQNKDEEYCQSLIKKGMQLFISNSITQFEQAKEVPIHFIGSIAYYLQDELKQTLSENGLSIGKVLRRPIDGLVDYHKSVLFD